MSKQLAPSKLTAAKTLFAAFSILKEKGGELPIKEIIENIPLRVQLNNWELQRYEKTGYIRWESIFHLYSIDCIKSGFLVKRKGIWILTDEGIDAMKGSEELLLERCIQGYKDRVKNNKKIKTQEIIKDLEEEDIIDEGEQLHQADLNQLEQRALEGLKGHVIAKNPYEFQDLVATLLRSMGYYVPYISPKGRDGGIDIIAYEDALGAKPPRIKVQVKHMPDSSISNDEVQRLAGLLNREGDIGIIVTSGRFTSEAEKIARTGHVHIELIDFIRFIELRKSFYQKLTDSEKNMLPLQAIYFLGSND